MHTLQVYRSAQPIRRATVVASILGLALAASSVAPTVAHAQSGIQQTPDSARYLINKFVPPNEQWAITFNLADQTATGNVFKTDGGDPAFIWCQITNVAPAPNPADTTYTMDCYGSTACTQAPCDESQWSLIATGITLPGSFLLPDGTQSSFSGNVQPILNARCAVAACHDSTSAQEGLVLDSQRAYDNLVNVLSRQDASKDRVQPFNTDASYLINKLLGTGFLTRMPQTGAFLNDDEMNLFLNWIREGAARN